MTARQPIHKTGNLLTKDDVQPTGIISEPPRSWKRPRDHVEQQEVSLAKKKKLEITHGNASPYSPYKMLSAITSPFKSLSSWIFTRPQKDLAFSQTKQPSHLKEEEHHEAPELKQCPRTFLNSQIKLDRSMSSQPVTNPAREWIYGYHLIKCTNPDISREGVEGDVELALLENQVRPSEDPTPDPSKQKVETSKKCPVPQKNKKLRRHRPSVKARKEMRPFLKKTPVRF